MWLDANVNTRFFDFSRLIVVREFRPLWKLHLKTTTHLNLQTQIPCEPGKLKESNEYLKEELEGYTVGDKEQTMMGQQETVLSFDIAKRVIDGCRT